MDNINFDIKDNVNWGFIQRTIKEEIFGEVKDSTNEIANLSQQDVAVVTGQLRDSMKIDIKEKHNEISATVSYNTPYAAKEEFACSKHSGYLGHNFQIIISKFIERIRRRIG